MSLKLTADSKDFNVESLRGAYQSLIYQNIYETINYLFTTNMKFNYVGPVDFNVDQYLESLLEDMKTIGSHRIKCSNLIDEHTGDIRLIRMLISVSIAFSYLGKQYGVNYKINLKAEKHANNMTVKLEEAQNV